MWVPLKEAQTARCFGRAGVTSGFLLVVAEVGPVLLFWGIVRVADDERWCVDELFKIFRVRAVGPTLARLLCLSRQVPKRMLCEKPFVNFVNSASRWRIEQSQEIAR